MCGVLNKRWIKYKTKELLRGMVLDELTITKAEKLGNEKEDHGIVLGSGKVKSQVEALT